MMPRLEQSLPGSRRAAALIGLARARRRQRGALFIEGLAVALTIGFLLAVISWFHSIYHVKGETLAAARLDAWQRARAGCQLVAAETLLDQRGTRSSVAP